MIRMMCRMRVVDRVSTDVLWDRAGVVVKIEDMIIQSCLPMVMSSVETLTPKYVRLWGFK